MRYLCFDTYTQNIITIECFYSMILLYRYSQYLNISQNNLGNIEKNAFEESKFLQKLDLSLNHLENLALKLPENMQHISLAGNQLKYWPLKNVPLNLHTLELQENELTGAIGGGKNRIALTTLKFLNISRNHINSLSSAFVNYPDLEVFDGSYNAFTNIPPQLGSHAPKLKILKLRGNPIKTIEFNAKISAHSFDLSELPLITEFDANAFNSIGLYPTFIFIFQ